MRLSFSKSVLDRLVREGEVSTNDSFLAVCAGKAEVGLFSSIGLANVTITSLDPVVGSGAMAPYVGMTADVRKLPFDAAAFDFVFVSDGLHHCDSPHAALVEMYRVAKKGVIVFESRDSLVARIGVKLGFVEEYELSAVIANGGRCAGVNYTAIPNYVYRWTERDFEKTIRCADPTGNPRFSYVYEFTPPRFTSGGFKAVVFKIAVVCGRIVAFVLRGQVNSFCMIALKPAARFPWLILSEDGSLKFRMPAPPTLQ